ncbi:ArsR/SmtB family transcription factor [Mesorhizobium marinum]|uniref:ArsR/SmtB family transcription factor n=1 Tax=Mesorhizobium marinum TaxID=3228790 RepID=UPI0034651376
MALTPLRRTLLELLREPNSASRLARSLDVPRQRIGYHLKCLQEAGLIKAVGEVQRRGFAEKLYSTASSALVIDPQILGSAGRSEIEKQDRYASGHLIEAAARMVRDVSRMESAAAEEGSRLLTFTIETEIAFARPADIERYAADLADALHALASKYGRGKAGKRYSVVVGGHPAPAAAEEKNVN